jgi:putative SOS response-associated peptidase YedK
MEIINEINSRYKEEASQMKTGEIFPTDKVPVITADADGKRSAKLFKWGFPNFIKPGGVIINARSETLAQKPAFSKILHTGRCLVPASGFYEWKAAEGKKEKYLIRTSDRNFFYMAGLYNSFIDKKGNPFTGFVIITTDANRQMSAIHNRMPVILDTPEAGSWLLKSPGNSGLPGSYPSVLEPYQSGLEFYRAS